MELIAEKEERRLSRGPSPSAARRGCAPRGQQAREREGRGGGPRRVAVAVAAPNDDGDNAPPQTLLLLRSSPPSSVPPFLTLPAQLVIAALGFRTPSLGRGDALRREEGRRPRRAAAGGSFCRRRRRRRRAGARRRSRRLFSFFFLPLPFLSSSSSPGPLRHGLGPQGAHRESSGRTCGTPQRSRTPSPPTPRS